MSSSIVKANTGDAGDEGSSVDKPPTPSNNQLASGVQLLPLLKKFFKFSAASVVIWFAGYFRFSTAWILIALFVYLLNDEYQKQRRATRDFLKAAGKDEKLAILAGMDQLPSWVFFPDVEKAEWLNKMLKQMWPFIGEYVKDMLKTSVEPSIEASLPSTLKPFVFTTIDLGDNAPRVGGIKVYTENVKRDEIVMDVDLMYYSDCEVKMSAHGISAGIKDLMLHGTVRIHMCPLINKVPIIGGMTIFFLNSPRVDFDFTNLANILDFPVLSNTLRSIIVEQIGNFMVLPNKIPVALSDLGDMSILKYPIPQGVVRLNMYQAKDLVSKDFGLGRKTSDPYCKIYVGAQTFKTEVKNNTLNPVWNQYFEAIVDQRHGQFAEIDLFDKDPDKDDELGTTSLALHTVAEHGMVDTWMPLEGVKSGMVHLRAMWLHLSKDPSDLDKAVARNKSKENMHANEEQLAAAILLVHLDSAKQLPKRNKRGMLEPSPYAEVTVGKTVHKSHVKSNTCNPTWEQNFLVLVNDPLMQDLELKVKDGKKDSELGDVVIPLKSVYGAKDMLTFERYALKNSSYEAHVSIRLCLRILTSEQPADWARDSNQPTSTSTPKDPATPPAKDQATPAAPAKAEDPTPTTHVENKIQPTTISQPSPPDFKTEPHHRKIAGSDSQLDVPGEKQAAILGKIQMTIRYSPQRKKLVLVVHKCVDLIPCDSNHLSDPYVRIYLMPERTDKRKTNVCKDSLNPIFDETFEWSLSPEEVVSKTLEVTVKNETGFLSKSRTMMGHAYVDLSRLDLNSAVTEWFILQEEDDDKSH